jgi:histidinol-phosphate/aromatic aminotransferase/cobyric acid decarboxylase-like protein
MMDHFLAKGISVSCGRVPFFLARFNNVPLLRQQLLREHHIAVRDCTSFGLMDTIRIMPSLQPENDPLLKALKP